MWYATKIAEMNELDPYLSKKNIFFEIGLAENFLEPEKVERIPKNQKFWNDRLLKKKNTKIMNFLARRFSGVTLVLRRLMTQTRYLETSTHRVWSNEHVFGT